MATKRAGPSAQRVTSLGSVAELERTGSKGSVNFSRPISAQNSPPTSPMNERTMASLSSDQPSSRPTTTAMSPGEVRYVQQLPQGPSAQSSKKKSTAAGTGSARNSGELGNPPARVNPTLPTNNAGVAPPTKKKKKRTVSMTDSDGRATYASDSDSAAERTVAPERPATFNTRAALLLSKQPSIVREDRDAEEREERSGAGVNRVRPDLASKSNLKPNQQGSPLPTIFPGQSLGTQQHTRSTSQPAPTLPTTNPAAATRKLSGSDASLARGNDSVRGGRHQSLSPARAAHFSPQPILKTPNGVRHQPPPRSVSPAKSAMKLPPSPRAMSPSGGLPGSGVGDLGHAPSEASDTISMLSEDGVKSRRKKNRVSFDDYAIVVVPGRAISPPASPELQSNNTSRGWFGLGHGKKQKDSSSANDGQDDDEVIKPTPRLPLFGSVRRYQEREIPDSQNEPSSPSTKPHHAPASWAQDTLARINMSSDQGVGAILSQDFMSKPTTANEPLPPLVTSVEGTGYGSDTDGSVYSTDNLVSGANGKISEAHAAPYRDLASPPLGDEGDDDHNVSQRDETVPYIAVQPATPAEDTLRGAEWIGDSPASTDSHGATNGRHEVVEHHPTDPTPATIGIAEPEPEGVLASREPAAPVVGGVAEAIRTQTEHEDDAEDTGESIYSDAAEDLSDLEGDGFGSINAIVESPVVDTFGIAITTPPDSPSGRLLAPVQSKKSKLSRLASNESQPGTEEGWDKAQAYWSGLSESRKKQLERAAAQEGDDEVPYQAVPKPKKKKKSELKKDPGATTQVQASLPPWPDQQYIEQTARSRSPRMTEMKSSMRNGAASTTEAPHMRKSMRTGDSMRSSMGQASQPRSMDMARSQEPRGTLQKKYRPISAVPLVNYNTPSSGATPSHNRTASGGSVPASATPLTPKQIKKKTGPTANLRRAKSNDSDSSSSFKKQRRPSTSDGGRYSMKKSMRGNPTTERQQSPVTSRAGPVSLRSSSPTGSMARRPFSSGGHGMRSSLRGSAESGAPSLRPERTKSPMRGFGLGKSSKTKPSVAPSKSRFSSKFGDSSDDEDGPRTFRSRFGDSSDEDGPSKRPSNNLKPVRGIPKRADEGDSTDLDDSSGDEKRRLRQKKVPFKPTKPEGTALAAGSLRRNGSGRDLSKFNEMGTGLQAKKAAENDPKRRSFFRLGRKKDNSKVKKPELPSTPIRDGLLDRARLEGLGSSTPTSPKPPKLQRRNTPMRLDSNTWPLPPVPGTVGDRPSTADGPASTIRPDLGLRSSTLDTPDSKIDGQNGVVVGRTGKKKKFPGLRNFFRLHD